jgi:hypothetical protein
MEIIVRLISSRQDVNVWIQSRWPENCYEHEHEHELHKGWWLAERLPASQEGIIHWVITCSLNHMRRIYFKSHPATEASETSGFVISWPRLPVRVLVVFLTHNGDAVSQQNIITRDAIRASSTRGAAITVSSSHETLPNFGEAATIFKLGGGH